MYRKNIYACLLFMFIFVGNTDDLLAKPKSSLTLHEQRAHKIVMELQFLEVEKALKDAGLAQKKKKSGFEGQRQKKIDEARKQMVVKMYAEYFTDEELDGLIAFYSSPLGRKLNLMEVKLATDPEFMSKVMDEIEWPTAFDEPKRSNLQVEMEHDVGAVRGGIAIYRANGLVSNNDGRYPIRLDDAQNGRASASNPLFGIILERGVTGAAWSKNDNVYTFSLGKKKIRYLYDPKIGTFTEM